MPWADEPMGVPCMSILRLERSPFEDAFEWRTGILLVRLKERAGKARCFKRNQ